MWKRKDLPAQMRCELNKNLSFDMGKEAGSEIIQKELIINPGGWRRRRKASQEASVHGETFRAPENISAAQKEFSRWRKNLYTENG
jgi:hypothetical protein